ncbi:hypothetical protein BDY17DRAFT_302905, partial [Neohortaea acidophila]
MRLPSLFAAGGAFISLAAAVPMQENKRDVVWTTKLNIVYETVWVTTTLPGVAPSPAAQAPAQGGGGGQPSPNTHTVTVEVSRAPVQTEGAASEASRVNSPAPTPTSSVQTHHRHHHHHHQAASPSSTGDDTPTRSFPTPTPVPIQTTSSDSTPTRTQATTTAGNAGGSSPTSPSGSIHTGDITYYAPGLGSCGITNSASDHIVALAADMMTPMNPPNPNDNPLCGRSITISYGGKTAVATIEDTCPGCSGASLDLTPSLFQIFEPLAVGRVSGVEWWY